MRNLFVIVSVFVFFALHGQEKAMTTSEITAFKNKVSATSLSTKTIQSDFTQYKYLDFLSNLIETSGNMAFKAPDMVKWHYTKPYNYSVVFNKDKLYINDDGSKSNVDLGNSKLFKKLNELIIASVKGDMFNDVDFVTTYLKTESLNKVVFVPKDQKIADYIASFELFFDRSKASVQEVKIIEPTGDYTQIIFRNRTLNQPLSDAVFAH
ncbi:MAG: outer membrane lipoprotein carrier protein LolA [Maribacter sp.]|nr:outer membrane lipoprotein carrier protein LolA [Maribacter sp.]